MKDFVRKIKGKVRTLRNNYRNRIFWRALMTSYLGKLLYPRNNGFYVTSEDWDYLIILDACRYDYFTEEIAKRKLQERLDYRISRGTNTPEFLLENFKGKKFNDIIYITANPYVDLLLKGTFYKIISVWKEGWDEKLKTTHPKTVFEYTLKTLKRYPDKRFIIHFIQPHFPYLTRSYDIEVGGLDYLRKKKINIVRLPIYELVLKHNVPIEDIIEGYKENLKVVMDYVEKLIDHLNGKIIITADHGEAFGEILHPLVPIKVFEHPASCRIEPLIKVPWFIIEKDVEKRKATKERVAELKKAIKKLKEKRLRIPDYPRKS